MLRLGRKLINAGVSDHPDHYQRRTTRFVNLFSLVMMTGLLIGFTNIFFLHDDYPYLNVVITFCFSVLCLVLNHYKWYMAATSVFLVTANYAIFYINEYYAISTAGYLFYFPLVLCVALLHNPSKGMKPTFIFFAISFLFMGLSIFGEFDFIRNPHVSVYSNELLFRYNLSISVVVSTLLVILVIRVIDSQNYQLMHALKKGTENQERISQNLREKEVMLSELHHRVKNNMSVISSLLNLQIGSTQNEEAKRLLADSRNRVASMSLVHEKLYRKKDFSRIAFDQYVHELVTELVRAAPDRIATRFELAPCELDISIAIPAGLVINEIVTNSLKHAFREQPINCSITVHMSLENGKTKLEISDNGKGFDFEASRSAGTSLGLILVESLVDQIDGDLLYRKENGSCYTLVF